MAQKITIEKNGIKITLEGYSTQELSTILTEEQKEVSEVNLNKLFNKQKSEPVKVVPLTIQDDFRHMVDLEEQVNRFRVKPLIVECPVKPAFIVTSSY